MMQNAWNSLAVGDVVQVHYPPFPPNVAVAGEVVRVTTKARRANDLAFRLLDSRRIVRPPLTAVHPAGAEASDGCWRCRAVGALVADPA